MEIAMRRERQAAHHKVARAVKTGELVKPDFCVRCLTKVSDMRGPARVEGHHPDYSKPLEVEWLCNRCHNIEHPKPRKAAGLPYTKDEKALRKTLGNLIICIRQYEAIADTLYADDRTERGAKIASALNGLTQATDSALYFGLQFDFREDKKDHPTNLHNIQKWAAKTKRATP